MFTGQQYFYITETFVLLLYYTNTIIFRNPSSLYSFLNSQK